MRRVIVLTCVVLCGAQCFAQDNDTQVVYTPAGALRGKWLCSATLPPDVQDEDCSSPFASFQGIPFAVPPLGNLRFRYPVPAAPWPGVLDAFESGSKCVQADGSGDENCLFLNVYTPQLPTSDASPLLPVLFWIYGGGFYLGSSDFDTYGPDFLIQKGVVIVAVNYRVGPLGFLSTMDSASPGNYGLRDQLLGLKWVKQNIKYFSGDPDRVTIDGQSAGSASVHCHVLSPLSTGFFHQAISQSGTMIDPWALQDDARSHAFTIGARFLILTLSSTTLVNRLRNVDAAELTQFGFLSATIPDLQFASGPVVEAPGSTPTPFFPDTPRNLIKTGRFNRVPYILGYTDKESLSFVLALVNTTDIGINLAYESLVHRYAAKAINANNLIYGLPINFEIRRFYFDGLAPTVATISQFEKFVTDMMFWYGIVKAIDVQRLYANTYFYEFSFFGKYNFNYEPVLAYDASLAGVAHADDLNYFWYHHNKTYPPTPTGSPERLTIDRVTTLWTNFVKYGTPTRPQDYSLLGLNAPWDYNRGVSTSPLKYCKIDQQLSLISKYKMDVPRWSFWFELERKYGQP